jgi:hypothetical protein
MICSGIFPEIFTTDSKEMYCFAYLSLHVLMLLKWNLKEQELEVPDNIKRNVQDVSIVTNLLSA